MTLKTPNKINWYLGASGLALIMNQERKHWLLKTDKTKLVQDSETGATFIGTVHNLGDHVIVESEKTSVVDPVFDEIEYRFDNVDEALGFARSNLPHITELNGLRRSTIDSIKYNIYNKDRNYGLLLWMLNTVYIPMSTSTDSSNVYSYKWYKTNTPPRLWCINDIDEFDDGEQAGLDWTDPDSHQSSLNPRYYYPAESNLQPFPIQRKYASNELIMYSNLFTDSNMIGLPFFWFTSDATNQGPSVTFTNIDMYDSSQDPDHLYDHSRLLEIGHAGNKTRYQVNVYPCTGTRLGSVPSGDLTDWVIRCAPVSGTFDQNNTDFTKPIGTIEFYSTDDTHNIGINMNGDNIITMTRNVGWTYDADSGMYIIPVETFESNLYEYHNPLKPAFDIQLDQSIAFEPNTTDAGFVGMQMKSSHTDEGEPRYPHDIQNLEGLPEWIQNNEANGVAQHMSIYALHNTPTYQPEDQSTRQIAGLIFDPGKDRLYPGTDETNALSIGRVYLLSNDDIKYENNATAEFPKPARTLARICDIPTSVMQLTNISGLAPTSVVDKKYIRSYASFTADDKDYLYNGTRDKWVRPTHVDVNGDPIYTEDSETQSNAYIFDSFENLQRVDLYAHNDFRELSNLNAFVDPQNVTLHQISNHGTDYVVSDVGIVVIGGFAFNYIVNAVDENGGVTDVTIAPSDAHTQINLSNFDLYDPNYGMTVPYGTSPIGNSTGRGLKLSFMIQNFDQLLPVKGNVVKGLCALVKETDGIWLYQYRVSGAVGTWEKIEQIAYANNSDTIRKDGDVTPRDAYINSFLPSVREYTVSKLQDNTTINIKSFASATSINVISQDTIPLLIPDDVRTPVDINKFYCHGFVTLTAEQRNTNGVIKAVEDAKLDQYDSYLVWKWLSNDMTDKQFTCGIIRRSLNNLMSQSDTSLLPSEYVDTRYVHTNPQTTVTWCVDQLGPMVWMFEPTSTTHEKYYMNADTRELYIKKETLTWSDVEITTSTHGAVTLVDSDGRLLFNIMVNSPFDVTTQTQPYTSKYVPMQDLIIGSIPTHQPHGSWRLVFPETHQFKLRGIDDNQNEFTPTKMQILRGSDLVNIGNVENDMGKIVNYKTLIINDKTQEDETELKIYNRETGNWNNV